MVPSSYDLNSRGSLNKNTATASGPGPRLDPRVPFMCKSRDFRQGMGGGILSVIFSADCAGPGLA